MNKYESFAGSERLNEDKAHEEANMMQVKLRESLGHEPTAEDYDAALDVLEEMKEEVANEDNIDRALLKYKKIITTPGYIIANEFVKLFTGGQLELSSHTLDSAAEKLQQLKDKAEEFGKE